MSNHASTKLNANGKRLAPPSSAPSPGNSNASPNHKSDHGTPSKRAKHGAVAARDRASPTPTPTPAHQQQQSLLPTPAAAAAAAAANDFGKHMMTQLTYAVDFLKAKRAPKTLQEVLDHLTLNQLPDMQQKVFASLMQKHSRIQHLPAPPRSNNNTSSSSSGDKAQPQPPPAWRTGRYTFKAKIAGVHDKVSLLEHLQRKTDASGLSVKDLKDGWPDCDAALAELERDRKVLVVRTRKDNHAKFVWPDDPRLLEGVSGSGPGGSGSGSGSSVIDAEFQALWHKIELPSLDDIVRKLQAVGQKPASEDPRLKRLEAPKQAAKKRRAARPPKNQSNSHMAHLLKDFSHMKR